MAELAPVVRRLTRRAWLAAFLCAGAGLARAQAAPADTERQVKAAYLVKFAGFVEWPAGTLADGSALEIGVAGNPALAAEVERAVAGRSVAGRALKVRRMEAGPVPGGLHILFIDGAVERRTFTAMLGAAHGQSVLTVSDAPDATGLGCMIGFVVAHERLRFDIALASVAVGGLKIGARMLAVAHRVRGAS